MELKREEVREKCRVTMGHLRDTIGHLRVTVGLLRFIVGHLRVAVTVGHMKGNYWTPQGINESPKGYFRLS